MLTRMIFLRSKHIHGRVMTNSILEEETILASIYQWNNVSASIIVRICIRI